MYLVVNCEKCRHLTLSPYRGQHLWRSRSRFHEARGLSRVGLTAGSREICLDSETSMPSIKVSINPQQVKW